MSEKNNTVTPNIEVHCVTSEYKIPQNILSTKTYSKWKVKFTALLAYSVSRLANSPASPWVTNRSYGLLFWFGI